MPATTTDHFRTAPFVCFLGSSDSVAMRCGLAAFNFVILLLLPELVIAAPPTEVAEKEAYQSLYEVFYEKDASIQASPDWCEACKALGSTRNPELITRLERDMWREDARVKSDHSLEHYPALWSLAEIGTPALRTLAAACRACKDERQATVLALALAKLYGKQRFAESYLRAEALRARDSGREEEAINVERVLAALLSSS